MKMKKNDAETGSSWIGSWTMGGGGGGGGGWGKAVIARQDL